MTKQRELLLVPFPFSDQSGRKVRPVIVISNDEFNEDSEDVLVVGVTSNILKNKYTINLTNENLDEGKLITNCCIKIENILKLDKELIIKNIGKINLITFKKIINGISTIINC
ncbi:MAG: type II toxin-antitoxin system PemK/MazF family toxin [archaeon]|nr:type II toxin-antitoxin system PemK/MazF family toxin [archaeon]